MTMYSSTFVYYVIVKHVQIGLGNCYTDVVIAVLLVHSSTILLVVLLQLLIGRLMNVNLS